MEEDIYLDKLDRRGIKPTAIRLLVIKSDDAGRACGVIARFGNTARYSR